MPAKTVWVLGAGFNCPVDDFAEFMGHEWRAPLAQSFFRVAMADSDYWHHARRHFPPITSYIYENWGFNEIDLRSKAFDLEECFTRLQQGVQSATARGDVVAASELRRIRDLLLRAFAGYLHDGRVVAVGAPVLREVADLLVRRGDTIITFNYDLILESLLEFASGYATGYDPAHQFAWSDGLSRDTTRSLSFQWPDLDEPVFADAIGNPVWNWSRERGYGVRFKVLTVPGFGRIRRIDGDVFYEHPKNVACSPLILKLHGSLNWFWSTDQIADARVAPKHPPRAGLSVISDSEFLGWTHRPLELSDYLLEPMIVAPELHKSLVDRDPLSELWRLAASALSTCEQLIVVGYSMPSTDTHVRKLLERAFSGRPSPQVIVANPNQASADRIARATGVVPRRVEALQDVLALI